MATIIVPQLQPGNVGRLFGCRNVYTVFTRSVANWPP